MEIPLIISLLVIAIGGLMQWINKYKNYGMAFKEKHGFLALIAWIVFGFFAQLDYSDNWGCIVIHQPFWELKNILFSSISIGLILWAFKTENQSLKKLLCFTELMYWIFKLIAFKGGYVFGFGGLPNETIVLYDFIAVLARLFVISQIMNVQRFKLLKITFLAVLILAIKINFFATPIF